ncbi:MAG TPA: BNR-4 repeat-containing protein, partial [Oceanipulchritudo sp.]|nr:BNR-4 repeat-containing protein [Oceanipulchritudo sp.]
MNRYLKVTITWTSLLLVLAGFCTVSNAQYNRAADAHGFTVYLTDGGWCWYQDPRAALNDGHLLIGAVKGNGDGEAIVGVYDLEANQPLAKVVVNPAFDHDDHNSPVFFVRPDNRVLTVYARHNVDNIHHLRVSEAGDLSKWGPPSEFAHDYADNVRVTYMNLLEMRDEGKLYNFFRGADWNPWFITSTDGGDSWGEPTHFIGDELEGVQRPYCRYAGNGKDSVFVSLTDAHPRQYGNSIYYAEFRGGKFFKADGSLVKDLKADGPLLPSEADLVYQGSGLPGRGHALSAEGAAWTSSIAADKQGHPHIAYTLYLSNTDHRYRLASWDGNKWVDREV